MTVTGPPAAAVRAAAAASHSLSASEPGSAAESDTGTGLSRGGPGGSVSDEARRLSIRRASDSDSARGSVAAAL